jgi:hypothetical protein
MIVAWWRLICKPLLFEFVDIFEIDKIVTKQEQTREVRSGRCVAAREYCLTRPDQSPYKGDEQARRLTCYRRHELRINLAIWILRPGTRLCMTCGLCFELKWRLEYRPGGRIQPREICQMNAPSAITVWSMTGDEMLCRQRQRNRTEQSP